ncbi:MAG: hypothetical protein ACHQ2Z_08985 [Elusimicrobiota bacterium]
MKTSRVRRLKAAVGFILALTAVGAAPSEPIEHWGAYDVRHLPLTGGIRGGVVVLNDGTLVVASFNHSVYFLRPDGSLRGQFAAGRGALSSHPVVMRDGTVAIAFCDIEKKNKIYFLNPDGSERAEYETAGCSGRLISLREGGLAIGFNDQQVLFLSSAGRLLGKIDSEAVSGRLGRNYTIGGKMLELKDGSLVIDGRHSFLIGRDRKTLHPWPASGIPHVMPQLVFKNGDILAETPAGLSVTRPDGVQRRQFPYPVRDEAITTAVELRDGGFSVTSSLGRLDVFFADGRSWKFKASGAIYSAPLELKSGNVVAVSEDHKIYFLSPQGSLLGRFQADTPLAGPMAELSEGTLAAVGTGDYGASHNLYLLTSTGRPFEAIPATSGRTCRVVGRGNRLGRGINLEGGHVPLICDGPDRFMDDFQPPAEQNCIGAYPNSRPTNYRLVKCQPDYSNKVFPAGLLEVEMEYDCEICAD